MEENKYAQVLRWIANGESVQRQASSGEWWHQSWEDTLEEIAASHYEPEHYRIEPRTMTISGLEVEAPLVSIAIHQEVWMCDGEGNAVSIRYASMPAFESLRDSGRLFATQSAAKAAYDAITALLTGKEGV